MKILLSFTNSTHSADVILLQDQLLHSVDNCLEKTVEEKLPKDVISSKELVLIATLRSKDLFDKLDEKYLVNGETLYVILDTDTMILSVPTKDQLVKVSDLVYKLKDESVNVAKSKSKSKPNAGSEISNNI